MGGRRGCIVRSEGFVRQLALILQRVRILFWCGSEWGVGADCGGGGGGRVERNCRISLFHRAFQFTIYNGPTNALVCNKTLIQMSHIKTLKITPKCFDHQWIIIKELFDPG
jgi:hypothetical protein